MSNGGVPDSATEGHDSDSSARTCLDLADDVEAVRRGRRFVETQVAARGPVTFADDIALAAAELLANACQHGDPPFQVCVSGDAELLRVEVRDGSGRAPVRPSPSATNMTGRGLTLVEAVARRWGVERRPEGGKSVWAEFCARDMSDGSEGSATPDAAGAHDIDAILADWSDEGSTADQRFTVVLGDVPTDLLIAAKAHIDNLVRELSLARAGGATGGSPVPEHLATLIATVVDGFSDARDAIKRQALAAARRGEPRTRLTLHLPPSAAAAGEAYLQALDEADEYSRAARLLTLETPPDHRLFRRWYVEAVVRRLRELAAGVMPSAVTPFDELLVAEIRRLSAAARVSERAARLHRVIAALARTRTPEDVAEVVVSEGVDALGASGGGLLVPAGDGEHVAVPGAVGYASDLVGALREERLDAPLPGATALRTGRALWLESQEDRDRDFPELRGFESSTVSMCAVPLVVADRVLGALRFSFGVRRLFDDDERAFVLALAAQTAQTLERTELYEAERRATLGLQRALLPRQLPTIAGWDVATYYSPAGDQEAGGDFYDVLPVAGGKIAAVVGDVMGRGVEAAASMAQIRSTIRAYAIDDSDPVRVFERVDAFFEALGIDQLATVLYLLVDPDNDVVHIANAGHLSPLVVDQNGCRVVRTATGTPFGVGEVSREVVAVSLPAGSAIIAITDGLVERRGEDIDEGIARIVEASTDGYGWDAQRLLDHVVSVAAAQRTHDDDVTVLVLRRH